MAEKKDATATKVKNPLAEAQNWEQRVKTELEVNICIVHINRDNHNTCKQFLFLLLFYILLYLYLCFSICVFLNFLI